MINAAVLNFVAFGRYDKVIAGGQMFALFAIVLAAGLIDIPALACGFALIMVLIGVGFKLSVVPLHLWSPDVYQGAPTPVTAFLSTGPKIAGFALLIRFLTTFQPDGVKGLDQSLIDFNMILAVLAITSMIIGNFGAIWQNNVKRMLAYSSIGHTGFMLMALFVFSDSGFKALIFYMVIYVIMNMAAFMIVDEIEEKTGAENMDDYRGMGRKLSLLMVIMVVVLVSLTGLPPTAGFTGKFLVFSSALEAYTSSGSQLILLMIITGAISTLVSLFYYFKIPLNAFLRETRNPIIPFEHSFKTYLSIFLAFLLIYFIIFPSTIEKFL